MPEYTFTGLTGPHEYPESRHSDGTPVRSVMPGEIRDLPGPIDHLWRETTDADREAWAAVLAATEEAAETAGAADDSQDAAAVTDPAGTVPQDDPPKPPRTRKNSTSEAGFAGGSEG